MLQEKAVTFSKDIESSFFEFTNTVESLEFVVKQTADEVCKNISLLHSSVKSVSPDNFESIVICKTSEDILQFSKSRKPNRFISQRTHTEEFLRIFLEKSISLITDENKEYSEWITAALNELQKIMNNDKRELIEKIKAASDLLKEELWKCTANAAEQILASL